MEYELLGNIVDVSKGKKHNPVEYPTIGAKRIIGINDLRNDNVLIFTDDSNGVEAYENDILIAWDGANAGTIGYGKTGYIGSTIARLRIKSDEQYSGVFLGQLLQSKFKQLRSTTTGATIPHINRAVLDAIKVPRLALHEQIRIADLLTRAEKLIAKRKESIKALDELLKSTFLEMFGNIRLKKSAYPWKKLRPFLFAQSGKSSKGILSNTKTNFPIYGGNGINGWAREALFSEPIVIAGRVGQQCGVIHVSKGPCWVTDNAIILIIRDTSILNSIYLAHALSQSPILEKVRQLDLPFINQSMLLDIFIPIPDIRMQEKFAKITAKINLLKEKYNTDLDNLELLLILQSHKLFNGV